MYKSRLTAAFLAVLLVALIGMYFVPVTLSSADANITVHFIDVGQGDCIFIDGTVQNNASVPAGVELTATAYNAVGTPVGTFTYWPAGATNIAVGVDYAYGFFLCDLSVSGEQVTTVEVVVSDVAVY